MAPISPTEAVDAIPSACNDCASLVLSESVSPAMCSLTLSMATRLLNSAPIALYSGSISARLVCNLRRMSFKLFVLNLDRSLIFCHLVSSGNMGYRCMSYNRLTFDSFES